MKFMVQWAIPMEHRNDAFQAFSAMTPDDDAADHGAGIDLIGRWHDLAGFTGVAIVESDDPNAIANWVLNWNSMVEVEVTLVLDDEETRAVGRARFA